MENLTKVLSVLLQIVPDDPRQISFRMTVPVNVFAVSELIIRPSPGSADRPLYVRLGYFRPGTDGVVDVMGRTGSHTLEDAASFLERHPDVSDVQVLPAGP
jgi:hypothetical protein